MSKKNLYPGDDVKTPFKRSSKIIKPARLRPGLESGRVVILLSGRFKGRRVVFVKQLSSGLLLVTGPYKINGVPLKRVNQAYVIPTTTKVPVDLKEFESINDSFFARAKKQGVRSNKAPFFERSIALDEKSKKIISEKKQIQTKTDKSLIDSIKKTELMAGYLNSRFTIRKNTKPHELKF